MKKKLLSVVLAVAVAFTFSFAMVGTASAAASTDAPKYGDGNVTAVEWAKDYDSAVATVAHKDSTDITTVLFDKNAPEKVNKGDVYFYIDKSNSAYSKYGVDENDLVVLVAEYSKKHRAFEWNEVDLDDYWDVDSKVVFEDVLVYDVRNFTAFNGDGDKMSTTKTVGTPAAAYSAWYATKAEKTPAAALDSRIKVAALKDRSWNAQYWTEAQTVKMFSVEYPEYNAFEYETTATSKTDKADTIKIKPVAWTLPDVDFAISEAVLELPVKFTVTDANDGGDCTYYTDFAFTGVDTEGYVKGDATITYDGQAHSPALLHASKETTVTYAWKKSTDANYSAYAATAPEFKNVGSYDVNVKIVTNKNNNEVVVPATLKINPKNVRVYLVQKEFSKVYDGEGFEIPLDNYSYDGLIEGETLITGNEKTKADVGTYTILPTFDAAVKANYNVDIENLKAIGTITKADNDIHVQNKTYTIKRGKTKNVQIAADFGTPTFQKTSGYSKILVSKTGTITVKKTAKKGKTYNIKVKASVKGSTNYNADSKTVTLKVKVK